MCVFREMRGTRSRLRLANREVWLAVDQRLRLLRWSGDPRQLPDDTVRERLAILVDEAEASGPPEIWAGSYQAPRKSRGSAIPCLFTVVALGIVLALAAIGVFRAMQWVLA